MISGRKLFFSLLLTLGTCGRNVITESVKVNRKSVGPDAKSRGAGRRFDVHQSRRHGDRAIVGEGLAVGSGGTGSRLLCCSREDRTEFKACRLCAPMRWQDSSLEWYPSPVQFAALSPISSSPNTRDLA